MNDEEDIRYRRQVENRVAIRRMVWGGVAAFVGVAAIGVLSKTDELEPQRLVDYALAGENDQTAGTVAAIRGADAGPTIQDVFLAAGAAGTADPQQTLMRYCIQRNRTLRAQGIIQHGGARPGVMPETWAQLAPSDKLEIIQLAACIQAAGRPGQSDGVVVEAGLPKVVLASDTVKVAYR